MDTPLIPLLPPELDLSDVGFGEPGYVGGLAFRHDTAVRHVAALPPLHRRCPVSGGRTDPCFVSSRPQAGCRQGSSAAILLPSHDVPIVTRAQVAALSAPTPSPTAIDNWHKWLDRVAQSRAEDGALSKENADDALADAQDAGDADADGQPVPWPKYRSAT